MYGSNSADQSQCPTVWPIIDNSLLSQTRRILMHRRDNVSWANILARLGKSSFAIFNDVDVVVVAVELESSPKGDKSGSDCGEVDGGELYCVRYVEEVRFVDCRGCRLLDGVLITAGLQNG